MVNIHIVSGFLGAGKTTFIKKLMKIFQNEKNVILENEFGEVAIDADIVRREGYDVVELASGCICCSLKLDFNDALCDIIKNLKPDNIIIEPTGIGMLSYILDIFNNEYLKKNCNLDNIVTVIDGENYLEQEDVFGEFFKDQIVNAKTLFISKTENMDAKNLEEIITALRKLNSTAKIIFSNNFNELLEGKTLEHDDEKKLYIGSQKDAKDEIQGFDSIGINIKKIYSKEILEKKLKSLQKLSNGEIYRAKGTVPCKNGFLEFNYVGGDFSINENNIITESKVCIIGKNLKKARLKILFEDQGVKLYGK